MPPRVRRAPLLERIKSNLDPWDWLLWISEEINGNDWDEYTEAWATVIGVTLNVVFMIARAGSGEAKPSRKDDVFGDYEGRAGTGWLPWLFSSVVYMMSLFSFANAIYAFTRTRSYRLYERPIETEISTPSARRVQLGSDPSSGSPFRMISSLLAPPSIEDQAQPYLNKEIWELSVWDPTPICLRLFCLFSPGHVIVYWLFLPTAKLDPQPSVTVVKTIFLTTLLSLQLHFLRNNFIQQAKDSKIVHGEVLNEYDTKFVHPHLNRPVRDVGIQTPPQDAHFSTISTNEVDIYTPTTILKRGFRTHSNPAYTSKYDTDNVRVPSQLNLNQPRAPSVPLQTPSTSYTFIPSSASTGTDFSSPLKPPPNAVQHNLRQPHYRHSDIGTGDGAGGLSSQLRKTASTSHIREDGDAEKKNEVGLNKAKRPGSPLKRMSTPGGLERPSGPNFAQQRLSSYTGKGIGRRESGRF